MKNISRRSLVKGSLAAVVTGTALSRTAFAQSSDPITLGVSGPLTGPNAQYGAQWKQGFDLALDEINAAGGINGRPLAYVFEDSQSDPRQTVAIARKFVADERIVVEVGDFSSAASMAASPIYQRGGLVQFGFTNSHPDFTKGGDFMWSNCRQPGGRDAAAGATCRARSRPQEARHPASQQRLGAHRQATFRRRRSRSAAPRWSISEGYLAGREGFPLRASCARATPIRTASR